MRGRVSSGLPVLAGTVGNAVSRWFLLWLLARHAGGAASVGLYAAILAIATPIFVVAHLGLRTIFLSAVVRWPWRPYIILRVIGAGLAIAVISFIASHNPQLTQDGGGLVMAVVAMKVADAFVDIQYARAQVLLGLSKLGYLSLANAIVTVLLSSVLVLVYESPTAAIYAAAVASLIVGTCAVRLNRGAVSNKESRSAAGGAFVWILRRSLPVTLSQFLSAFTFQIPILFVAYAGAAADVGKFATAAYFLTLMNLVGGVLQTITITPLRDRWSEDTSVFRKAMRDYTRATIVISLTLALPVAIFGDKVLGLLYGNAFRVGPFVMAILAVAMLCLPASFLWSAGANVANRYGSVTWAMACACLAGGSSVIIGWWVVGASDVIMLAACAALVAAVARAGFMYAVVHFSIKPA